ncbi:MAG: hypothetical protein ACFFCQ_13050, partial [Promethearchaeota archaeon]
YACLDITVVPVIGPLTINNFFTIDGNYQTLLGEEINPFSPITIQSIEQKVNYLIKNQEIAAIKVTFFDDDPPAMKYHAFYADPSFIISLTKQHDLTVLPFPELKIRKKSSFIKNYPLIIEQRK